MSCIHSFVSCRGRRYHIHAVKSHYLSLQGNKKQSSGTEIILSEDEQDKTSQPLTLVTINALILPVCGIWGPTHKSTMGPQRYTVVDVPSGTLVSMRYFLYLLYWKVTSLE